MSADLALVAIENHWDFVFNQAKYRLDKIHNCSVACKKIDGLCEKKIETEMTARVLEHICFKLKSVHHIFGPLCVLTVY